MDRWVVGRSGEADRAADPEARLKQREPGPRLGGHGLDCDSGEGRIDMNSIHESEIRWTFEPLEQLIEDVDVLTLTESELLAHVVHQAEELRWLRRMAHEGLAHVTTL